MRKFGQGPLFSPSILFFSPLHPVLLFLFSLFEGTVEYLYNAASNKYYFLELNPRLQVLYVIYVSHIHTFLHYLVIVSVLCKCNRIVFGVSLRLGGAPSHGGTDWSQLAFCTTAGG